VPCRADGEGRGAHVRFSGVKWHVVALSGQDIHLIGPDGGGEAVLARHHPFAAPRLHRHQGRPMCPTQPRCGRTAPPTAARETALAQQRQRQRHVREVECGLADGPRQQSGGAPYGPARHSGPERDQAKPRYSSVASRVSSSWPSIYACLKGPAASMP
jgi:hypothetical protein